MNTDAASWLILTPQGALYAFSQQEPAADALALQSLLTGESALDTPSFLARSDMNAQSLRQAIEAGWVQVLSRPLQGPDARLDDFLQHVIGSLSAERRAVLASESGFCLGHAGMPQEEADALSAAAADFGDFAARQRRRGWAGASSYVAFHTDPEFLLPTYSFLPLWVDGVGYWLILGGEPLLNNAALVELMWGLKLAGTRFSAAAGL